MSDLRTTRDASADSLDVILRRALKAAMASRGFDENDLAKELSIRSGRTINAGLVHAWRAESKHRWHLPADLIPILCEILNDDSIQRLLLSDKLRQSLELGESTECVVSQLRRALKELRERSNR